MGVGPQPGRVQPHSVLIRHGGSLVFLSLTWHIPSVAAAMMVGAVHLSLADVYYRAMLAGRGRAVGLVAAGALFTLGRWGHGKLREWAALHTGGGGGDGTLDARWRLVGKDGNELALKRSTINEPVAGQGYQALVQGMNRLLSSLAREIASEIRSRADTSARSQS